MRSVIVALIAASALTAPAASRFTSTLILERSVRIRCHIIDVILNGTHFILLLAFICMYPGCNRRFNVNSNMRRHYRNHLTPRRGDLASKFLHPASPSLSASTSGTSAADSPISLFAANHSAMHDHRYSASRSMSPSDSASAGSESEDESPPPVPQEMFRRRQTISELSRETRNMSLRDSVAPSSFEQAAYRARSLSSPIHRHTHGQIETGQGPVGSPCNVPGCNGCQPGISTALRPAFPENTSAQGRR